MWAGFSPWGISLYQPMRQPKSRAEQPLPPRHFALIGFMIVARQMKQAVQHENLDFNGQRMALLFGLAKRRGHADGEVSGNIGRASRRKRQHIRSLVDAPELPIEAADGLIRREQDGDFAAQRHGGLREAKELREGARGGDAAGGIARRAGRWSCAGEGGRRRVGVQIWIEEDHRAGARKTPSPVSNSILTEPLFRHFRSGSRYVLSILRKTENGDWKSNQ
jgi:hypothetical protein